MLMPAKLILEEKYLTEQGTRTRMFVWLTMALSCPFKEDRLALPLPATPLSPPGCRWCDVLTPSPKQPFSFLGQLAINSARHAYGGGDSSVVRAPDSWLKGRGFESLLERREMVFFSSVDLLCWLLFRYPFHPRVTTVARTEKIPVILPKVQVAGYS